MRSDTDTSAGPPDPHESGGLSRRERQLVGALFARGEATAEDLRADLPDPPSAAGVRKLLSILESKCRVVRTKRGRANVWRPAVEREPAARSALREVLHVFFGGSIEDAVQAHLADPDAAIDEEARERMLAMIREAKESGR